MPLDVSDDDRLAALGDLRELIRLSRERGELETIDGADTYLEMGALYELSLEKRFPPLLLFQNIKGYSASHHVLMNVRFSRLFAGDLSMDALKAFRKRGKWEADPIPPVEVNAGPVCENIVKGDKVNIKAFPAGHWHELDGGAYIGTECLIINKDPDSDWVNIGTYRVQVQDEKTLTVFIEPGKHGSYIREKWWKQGKACPMVVCVGQAPILGMVASSASRHGVSELGTAGGRLGHPIKIVRGELTGLPIPADAEVAFEGFMPPPEEETRPEGPFAEWPGYYASDAGPEPVVRVGAIYHRNDPILIGQPPAKPTFPGRQQSLGGMAAIWDALEAAGVPGVQGVWKPLGGGVSFVNIVSIKQLHPGHNKMAGLVAAGCGPAAYMSRVVIVVDDDIDITDSAEVMWALATRWDPKTQTDVIDGCWTGHIDPLLSPDKREAGDLTTARIILYATRPYHWKDQFPKVNTVSKGYADTIEAKWADKLKFLARQRAGRGTGNS
ncbi:MAG TPA: UbiD family decarboxylase [Alphaproteobacteria bacterium]|nr:UbiD family decarboxylase [Alphaproteobacteria bacterium]